MYISKAPGTVFVAYPEIFPLFPEDRTNYDRSLNEDLLVYLIEEKTCHYRG